jgi:hypothetical protein
MFYPLTVALSVDKTQTLGLEQRRLKPVLSLCDMTGKRFFLTRLRAMVDV